jgi:hypothetical protein
VTRITININATRIYENDTITLTCKTDESNPSVDLKWNHNNANSTGIQSYRNGTYGVITISTLTFKAHRNDDVIPYECFVNGTKIITNSTSFSVYCKYT